MTLLWLFISLVLGGKKYPLLTEDTFQATISTDVWFVNFFSPTCPHCQYLEPKWDKMAEEMDETLKSTNYHLAAVDCIAHTTLCDEHGIEYYPTLYVFKNGNRVDEYNGPRETADLKKYVDQTITHYAIKTLPEEKSTINPSGQILPLTSQDFTEAVKKGPIIVKFFVPWCTHCKAFAPTWKEFATTMKNQINVAEVNCNDYASVCKENNVRGYPTVKFFYADTSVEYNGERTIKSLQDFVDPYIRTSLPEISLKNYSLVQVEKDSFFIYFDKKENFSDSLQTSMFNIAKSLSIQSSFYISSDSQLMKTLSIDETELPKVVLIRNNDKYVYHGSLKENFSESDLIIWIQKERIPSVITLNANNSQDLFSNNDFLIFGMISPKSINFSSDYQALKNAGRKVEKMFAKSHQKIQTVFLDAATWGPYINRIYGYRNSDLPRIVIANTRVFFHLYD